MIFRRSGKKLSIFRNQDKNLLQASKGYFNTAHLLLWRMEQLLSGDSVSSGRC
jgi:hypothetical protein